MDFMNITLYFLLLISKIKRIIFFFIGLYRNKLPLLWSISNPNISDYLSNAIINIPKFPNQISLILQEDVNLESLSDIILWSFSIGISCVSVLDIKGEMKFLQNNLLTKITKNLKHYSIKLPITICSLSEKSKISNLTNELIVIILDVDSPRSMIVDAAKSLSSKDGNISITDIDNYLKRATHLDSPEMTINFGSDYLIRGLMPWQSGSTELIFHQTHHHITVSDYIEIIADFARRDQRWGK